MPQRVIAIGDIHGCSAAFRAIVDEIAPTSDDTLIILGDCVDRGPDSCGVIDQMLALRDRCRVVPILGNHEEMMLSFLDGRPQPDDWLQCGGATTLASYSSRRDPRDIRPEHLEYIRGWIDCFQTDAHFFVHGCYEPERPLAEQRWLTLRWHSLRDGIPGPHISDKIAVVGHTSQKNGEVLDLGYLLCIDTYCWGGGWLTALEVATGRTWQVDRDGKPRR